MLILVAKATDVKNEHQSLKHARWLPKDVHGGEGRGKGRWFGVGAHLTRRVSSHPACPLTDSAWGPAGTRTGGRRRDWLEQSCLPGTFVRPTCGPDPGSAAVGLS